RSSIRSTSVVRSATELSLAPVEFVQKPTVHREQHSPLLVELVGGRRIAVSSGFDAETLTRLIAVIEQAQRDAGHGRGYAHLCCNWLNRYASWVQRTAWPCRRSSAARPLEWPPLFVFQQAP